MKTLKLIAFIGMLIILEDSCKKDETEFGSLTDSEGNKYKTIKIGEQVWMAENLKATRYNDSTSIPLVRDAQTWIDINTPAYCWYNNDSVTYKETYGVLYNWYAVNTKKLCPTGWHVPTDIDWTNLVLYFGGERAAGEKMKESDTIHWQSPNTGATNESDFTALPGGYRHFDTSFKDMGYSCRMWSSTQEDEDNAWYRVLLYYSDRLHRLSSLKQGGYSVRCKKD